MFQHGSMSHVHRIGLQRSTDQRLSLQVSTGVLPGGSPAPTVSREEVANVHTSGIPRSLEHGSLIEAPVPNACHGQKRLPHLLCELHWFQIR